jgi:hypothetical protein
MTMHPGLFLLLRLRIRGWARRLFRSANSVRGALLFVVGCLVFVGWVTPLFLESATTPPQDPEQVRRWGPLALLGIWLMNVLFSSSEGAITFTSAEVNLLFPAPLSRRQLLVYKISLLFTSSVISALFMALFFRRFAGSFFAAVLALTLCLFFLQLFTVFLSLLASTIGARAYNRRRRIVLALVLAGVALVVAHAALTDAPSTLEGWLDHVNQSPVAQFLLAPLRWFVLAMTADRFWPDLALWTSSTLLLNALVLVAVFVMDAQYLEASAAASERLYARVQQVRRGSPFVVGSTRSGKARWSLPVLPSWGGVGPILWRQMSTALRGYWSIFIVLAMTAAMSIPLWFEDSTAGNHPAQALWPRLIGLFIGMTLFVPVLLPFDFRGDIDRMDMLKVLPLPAWRLVVGQLLTPICLISLGQVIVVGAVLVIRGNSERFLLVAMAFALPLNCLIFELENMLFLFFPTRVLAATPGDVQALGRQVVLWMVKLFTLWVIGGLAALAGLLFYFLTGQNWTAALVAAWVVVAAFVMGLIPLIGLAFRRFDVAADTPP